MPKQTLAELADMVKALSLTVPMSEACTRASDEHPQRMIVMSLSIIAEQLALIAAMLAEIKEKA